MATGKEIKELYDMMKKVCQETSKLLIIINDMIENEGFKAVGDGSVMWGKSNHYRYPDYWLPYFFQRVFIKKGNSKKGIGVNIMFDGNIDGLDNTIPFITCGLLEFSKEKVSKGMGLYLAGWTEHEKIDKEFERNLCITKYTDGVVTTTYFLPLDILNNQEKVNQYIIKPLISLYEGDLLKTNDMISNVAIGLDEIIK
jgi:hypothetical protein